MEILVAQLLLHLPDGLANRSKQTVPSRQRSQFVQRLLEAALPVETDDPLYRLAQEVEKDEKLHAKMAEWEQATVADGLDPRP
jgi:hypothetical protein